MVNKKKVGQRIKGIRIQRKETLEEFAEEIKRKTDSKIKTTKSNVSKWEKGLNMPNDVTLKAISDIGNLSIDELLYGSYPVYTLDLINEIMALDKKTERQEKISRVFNLLTLRENKDSLYETIAQIAVDAEKNNLPLGDQNSFEEFFISLFPELTFTETGLLDSIAIQLNRIIDVIDITIENSTDISQEFSHDIQLFSEFMEVELDRLTEIRDKYKS